jgi:hypothetical protein
MGAIAAECRCGAKFGTRFGARTGGRSAAASCPRRSVGATTIDATKISEQAASRRQQLLPAINDHLGTTVCSEESGKPKPS